MSQLSQCLFFDSGLELSDRGPYDAVESGEVLGEWGDWLCPETITHVQRYGHV